jgi:hypothetical protein
MIVASFVAFAILVAAWIFLPSPKSAVEPAIDFGELEPSEAALAA